jgi:hypothetical protein
MLIAIKDIIDKSVDDGRFADSLIPQENYFILEKRRNGALC